MGQSESTIKKYTFTTMTEWADILREILNFIKVWTPWYKLLCSIHHTATSVTFSVFCASVLSSTACSSNWENLCCSKHTVWVLSWLSCWKTPVTTRQYWGEMYYKITVVTDFCSWQTTWQVLKWDLVLQRSSLWWACSNGTNITNLTSLQEVRLFIVLYFLCHSQNLYCLTGTMLLITLTITIQQKAI